MRSNSTTMPQKSAQRDVFIGSVNLQRGKGDMRILVPVCPGSRSCGVQSLTQLFKGLQVRGFRAEPVENAHGLWSKDLSGTTAATTSRASSTGWDGSSSFTTAAARR
ncbi:hypothetical protein Syun_029734 [Stephania yunnanensis]|uniref:Uncharacterized protein n=1 Tax=Stephania yunnanensis TaxID=152371 RepID=A0AAP0E5Y7_9MAGN